MNTIVTIPNLKKIAQKKGFVLIPRKEYEGFLRMKEGILPGVTLTSRQKRAIAASEKELTKKEYLSLHELAHELGRARTKARK